MKGMTVDARKQLSDEKRSSKNAVRLSFTHYKSVTVQYRKGFIKSNILSVLNLQDSFPGIKQSNLNVFALRPNFFEYSSTTTAQRQLDSQTEGQSQPRVLSK